ncbi:hypothetical protein BGP_5404 [Beggiatoa sp. PS]|nr:hypothetical protein BGP_5404 [Beggiatoa sp. PS]
MSAWLPKFKLVGDNSAKLLSENRKIQWLKRFFHIPFPFEVAINKKGKAIKITLP